jgi:electron transfer flavoprotein beta subunit|tara:strand:- start:144 stop:902 length:759 start_codon:yes stop_codon:yes gene_type:complete
MTIKVLVTIKRTIDYNFKVRPLADGSGVDTGNAKMSMNPFCEIAVEEAVRLKEKGGVDEIIVVSVGVKESQEQIRAALALGADRGILIETDAPLEPLALAKCLKVVAENEQPQLIISGKQSIDGDNNQTGQMLAALLGWPQGTFASELLLLDNSIEVTREVDGGLQTVRLKLPALITTDLRLNVPRYAALPNIMKAKKKPLKIIPIMDMGVDVSPRTRCIKVELPKQRQSGVKVSSVQELVEKLKAEAKVIS